MGDLRAAEEIVIAAAGLSGSERKEFSEWDLTIRVWELNKNRFGCRGYEDKYPDHKRVMTELMGKGKPVRESGWIEKTRRNHYRITALGLAVAARLAGRGRPSYRRAQDVYEALKRYAFHRVFEDHVKSEDEPKTWLGAAAFLALRSNDREELETRLCTIRGAIEEALRWMAETGMEQLRHGDADSAISRDTLARLGDFLGVLEGRFAAQFDAIRGRGKED